MKILNPLRAIRAKCVDCAETNRYIKYCTCDGVNGSVCPLWPYRFGIRPVTAKSKYGAEFVTPGALPDSITAIEDCQEAQQPQKVAV